MPLPCYTEALEILRDLEKKEPFTSCKASQVVPQMPQMPIPQIVPCFMATPQSLPNLENEEEYPSLIPHVDKRGISTRPIVRSKTMKSNGLMEPLTHVKEVLNQHTKSHLVKKAN